MKKRFVALFAVVLLFSSLAQAGPTKLDLSGGGTIEAPPPPPPPPMPVQKASGCNGGGC
jgi:hypothetical protein